jgi:predicted RNA binding protein YcfA (HicA-like mRNA interferase family)
MPQDTQSLEDLQAELDGVVASNPDLFGSGEKMSLSELRAASDSVFQNAADMGVELEPIQWGTEDERSSAASERTWKQGVGQALRSIPEMPGALYNAVGDAQNSFGRWLLGGLHDMGEEAREARRASGQITEEEYQQQQAEASGSMEDIHSRIDARTGPLGDGIYGKLGLGVKAQDAAKAVTAFIDDKLTLSEEALAYSDRTFWGTDVPGAIASTVPAIGATLLGGPAAGAAVFAGQGSTQMYNDASSMLASVPVQSLNGAAWGGFPTSHPLVANEDGSKSNVILATAEVDGKFIVFPTMVDGIEEVEGSNSAWQTALDHGLENYPAFGSQEEADAWAKKNHGHIREDGSFAPPRGGAEGQRIAAYLAGGAIGLTEALPIGRFIGRVSKMGGKKTLGKALGVVLASSLEEGIQEGVIQTPLEQIFSQHIIQYADKQSLGENFRDAAHAGLLGMTVGGLLSSAGVTVKVASDSRDPRAANRVLEGNEGDEATALFSEIDTRARAGEVTAETKRLMREAYRRATPEQIEDRLERIAHREAAAAEMGATNYAAQITAEFQEAAGILLENARANPDGLSEFHELSPVKADPAKAAEGRATLGSALEVPETKGEEALTPEQVAEGLKKKNNVPNAKVRVLTAESNAQEQDEDEPISRGEREVRDYLALLREVREDPSTVPDIALVDAGSPLTFDGVAAGGAIALDVNRVDDALRGTVMHELQHNSAPRGSEAFNRTVALAQQHFPALFQAKVDRYVADRTAENGGVNPFEGMPPGSETDAFLADEGFAKGAGDFHSLVDFTLRNPALVAAMSVTEARTLRDYVVAVLNKIPGFNLQTTAGKERRALVDRLVAMELQEGASPEEIMAFASAIADVMRSPTPAEFRKASEIVTVAEIVAPKKDGGQIEGEPTAGEVASMPRTAPDMFGETAEKEGTRGEIVEDGGAQGAMFQEDTGAKGQTSILDTQEEPAAPRKKTEAEKRAGKSKAAKERLAKKRTDVAASESSPFIHWARAVGGIADPGGDLSQFTNKEGGPEVRRGLPPGFPRLIGAKGLEPDALLRKMEEDGWIASEEQAQVDSNAVDVVRDFIERNPTRGGEASTRASEASRFEALGFSAEEAAAIAAEREESAKRGSEPYYDEGGQPMFSIAPADAERAELTEKLHREQSRGRKSERDAVRRGVEGTEKHKRRTEARRRLISDLEDQLAALPPYSKEWMDRRKVSRENAKKAKELRLRIAERERKDDEEYERMMAEPETPKRMASLARLAKRGLRNEGYTLERSKGGSAYYRHPDGRLARISTHAVPMTPQRADALESGGFTWAGGTGREFLITPFSTRGDVRDFLDPDIRFSVAPQEDTPQFKKWFKQSAVVDADGKPLVVYHGTSPGGFSEFNPESHFGTKQAAEDRMRMYLGRSAKRAGTAGSESFYPVYLSIQNPLDVTDKEASDVAQLHKLVKKLYPEEYSAAERANNLIMPVDFLKTKGFDGFRYVNAMEDKGSISWVAFSPTQIKSATGNRGTFDENNPDIRFSIAPQSQLGFYSNTEEALEQMVGRIGKGKAKTTRFFMDLSGGSADKKELMSRLLDAGANKEEMQWMLLEDWIDSYPETHIPIDEVRDFVRENAIVVGEKVLGGAADEDVLRKQWVDGVLESLYLSEEVEDHGGFVAYDENGELLHTYQGDLMVGESRGELTETLREYYEQVAESMYEQDLRAGLDPSMSEGEGPPKHGSYQLPGGENYRELLLTLPERIEMVEEAGKWVESRQNIYGDGRWYPVTATGSWSEIGYATKAESDASFGTKKLVPRSAPAYTEGHYGDTPNVLAHIRFNERTGPNGEKVLFIEEIQSDWHQEGAESGYKGTIDSYASLRKDVTDVASASPPMTTGAVSNEELGSAIDELQRDPLTESNPNAEAAWTLLWELTRASNTLDLNRFHDIADGSLELGAVPDAPFKTSWEKLAMRRAIRWAAENGFDQVAWTTGTQQIERYSTRLRQKVDSIEWRPYGEGDTILVNAIKDGSSTFAESFNLDGTVVEGSSSPGAEGKTLSEIVGKSMAAQIMATPSGKLEGDDLTIGGEGMKAAYDRRLVGIANKLGKQFGAKVGKVELMGVGTKQPTLSAPEVWERGGVWFVDDQHTGESGEFATEAEARAFVAEIGAPTQKTPDTQAVHSLPITEKMKGSVMQGQPMFSIAPKGRVPKLTEAAQKMAAGGTPTREQFRSLVDEYKPVRPYDHVPEPASNADMKRALGKKADKIGAGDAVAEGTRVGLRLDIPAYTRHGVWVPTIHVGKGAAKVIGYGSVASVTNAEFRMSEKAALKIAAGKSKDPFAMIRGDWLPRTPAETKALAEEALNDPSWIQVGMDPERHGYFYDRKTHELVEGADEVIQVGPLVLAKNPKMGDTSSARFSIAPEGRVDTVIHMNGEGAAFDKLVLDTKAKFPDADIRVNTGEPSTDLDAITPSEDSGEEGEWLTTDELQQNIEDSFFAVRKRARELSKDERLYYSDFSKAQMRSKGRVQHESKLVVDALVSEYVKITGDRITLDEASLFIEMTGSEERNETAYQRDLKEMSEKARPYQIWQAVKGGKPKHIASYTDEAARNAALKARREADPAAGDFAKEARDGWGHEVKPASGVPTSEARAFLREKLTGPDGKMYRKLRNWNRRVQREILDAKLRDGLISQELYDAIIGMGWKDYSSFRHAMKGKRSFSRAGGYGTKAMLGKRFRGRSSRPDNVIKNMIMDATKGLQDRHAAIVGREFLRMAEENPDPDVWAVVEGSLSSVKMATKAEIEEDSASNSGMVMREVWDARIERPDLAVPVMRDGKQFWVVMTPKHKRMAEAMNGPPGRAMGTSARRVVMITRFIGSLWTSRSVTFMLASNAPRDTTMGLTMLELDHGAAASAGVLRRQPAALMGFRDYQKGKKTAWSRRAERFLELGGQAGWFFGGDMDSIQAAIEGELKSKEYGKTRKAITKAFEFLEDWNEAVENGIRLATFSYLVEEAGMPEVEAIIYAKEMTVNFDMRGKWIRSIAPYYLFVSAAISGNRRIRQAALGESIANRELAGKMGKTFARRAVKRAAAGVVLAAIYDIMMWMTAGDDDDGNNAWDSEAEYRKDRNFYVPNPGGNPIPGWKLPYGLNVIPTFGRKIAEVVTGRKSVGKASAQMVDSLMGSFSPLGSVSISEGGDPLADVARILAPSILDIPVDILSNTRFTGSKIAPEPRAGDRTPGPAWQRAYSNTPDRYVALSKFLADIGGGTETRPSGPITEAFTPEAMRHAVDSFFGGTGKDVAGVWDGFMALMEGQLGDAGRAFPIIRAMMPADADKKTAWFTRRATTEIDYTLEDLKQRQEDGDEDEIAKFEVENRAVLDMESDLKELDKKLKANWRKMKTAKGEARRILEEDTLSLSRAFNKKARAAFDARGDK